MRLAEEFQRLRAGVRLKIEVDRLHEPCQVRHHQHPLAFVFAHKGEHLAVVRGDHLHGSPAERTVTAAQGNDPLCPIQQRPARLLGLHIQRFVVVLRTDVHRQVHLLRVRLRKAGVGVGAPLHGCAHAVAVAEVDVVAHPDLVAVVDHRRPFERKEDGVHQLQAPPVAAQQRRQPPPDTNVDPRPAVLGVGPVHVVALFVGHHLQRQFVMIAKEHRPAPARRGRGRHIKDVDNRERVFHPDRHEEARHQREMEEHVTFVAGAEVLCGVFRPLVRFADQDPPRKPRIHVLA